AIQIANELLSMRAPDGPHGGVAIGDFKRKVDAMNDMRDQVQPVVQQSRRFNSSPFNKQLAASYRGVCFSRSPTVCTCRVRDLAIHSLNQCYWHKVAGLTSRRDLHPGGEPEA